jgi:hypothetical protein
MLHKITPQANEIISQIITDMRQWVNTNKNYTNIGILDRLPDIIPRMDYTYTLTPWESDESQSKQKISNVASHR